MYFEFQIPTSCYLRLVALTENIRMDWNEIVNLVSLFNSDIRRVLLTLQLWVNSGGGQKVRRSIKERETSQEIVTNLAVIDENSCSQDVLALSKRATRAGVHTINDDDDDDFVSIKPITCKRQQLISDDESSNLAPPSGEKVLMEAQKCPAVNVSCLESILGLPIRNENGVLGFLNKTLQVCVHRYSIYRDWQSSKVLIAWLYWCYWNIYCVCIFYVYIFSNRMVVAERKNWLFWLVNNTWSWKLIFFMDII